MARRPNVIFIMADDLGWADLACYGADLHETPHLDDFARTGMRFTRAYAAAPVCSPTRASVLTGKHPARLHMTIWSEAASASAPGRLLQPPKTRAALPLEEVTIADVLGEDMLCAHVGKWHLGDASHYPEAQGFDINIGGTHWGCPVSYFYPYRGIFHSEEFRYIPDLDRGCEDACAYLTDRLTDEALAIMENARERPFFLHLCYYTVHTPIQGKPDTVAYFQQRLRPDLHHRHAGYAAMVASLDENVGRILRKLEELKLAEDTIVFFFSDNGGYIGRYDGQVVTDNFPLRSGKGALYEGGIRTPLIIRWPGVTRPGSECTTPVASTDFFRTILGMTGYAGDPRRAAGVDGVDLTPLLRDPSASLGREALFWHYPHYYETTTPVSAVQENDWKMLEYLEDGHRELYRLDTDPGETRDLAEVEPEMVHRLASRLDTWRRDVGAQMPTPRSDGEASVPVLQ